MKNYFNKYKKYKEKYLQLKKMLGGSPPEEYCIMSGVVGFPVGTYNEVSYNANCKLDETKMKVVSEETTDNIYTDIHNYLDRIDNVQTKNKTLILKVGSNDSVESKEYKLFTGTAPIIEVSSIPPIIIRFVRKFGKGFNDTDKLFMLSIDPDFPTNKPFNDTSDDGPLAFLSPKEENITYIKGCFPLATGNEKSNRLLKKIINLNANLILVNAMGSTCYRSFKAIIDNKLISTINNKIEYLTYVDVSQDAACPTDLIYDNEANFSTCKKVKPDYPDWINSNLT
jgi:hypothetical protein